MSILEINTALAGNLTEAQRFTRIATDLAAILAGASDEARAAFAATLPAVAVPDATEADAGVVRMAAFVADATDATDVVTQFNALLAALQASGAQAAE